MKQIADHYVLVSGSSFTNCSKQVTDFFERTLLVRYDHISIHKEECIPGNDPSFLSCIEDKIENNRKQLKKLIGDLEATGMHSASDLLNLEQGYPSKVLHIITHFLDGFIGIDTVFYNLLDDSHWLPEITLKAMYASPDNYWLIRLLGFSATPEKAALVQQ